jgi:hypothetical protein
MPNSVTAAYTWGMPTADEEKALLRERVWLTPRAITLLGREQAEKTATYIAAYFAAIQSRPFREGFH